MRGCRAEGDDEWVARRNGVIEEFLVCASHGVRLDADHTGVTVNEAGELVLPEEDEAA
ncbi:hypothetical protein [Microbacterium candidum]|uniref:Rieske domain-containing protein n=1 Tax=Microbacterium candidum TaxID=3041922 RepID=A0ABT7MWC4_9MICO|nr:hypothetical protein [Microbacterium sp. ASV49]MDL9978757.1 hypothetical protein [Microbacterium sp. ASV49]